LVIKSKKSVVYLQDPDKPANGSDDTYEKEIGSGTPLKIIIICYNFTEILHNANLLHMPTM